MLLSLLETILVTYLMDKNSQDICVMNNCEDKREKEDRTGQKESGDGSMGLVSLPPVTNLLCVFRGGETEQLLLHLESAQQQLPE